MTSIAKGKGQGKWGKADSITSSEDEASTSASDYDGRTSKAKRKSSSARTSTGRWATAETVLDDEEEELSEEPIKIVHFGKIGKKKVNMTVDQEALEKCLKSAVDYPICIINAVGPPNLGKGFVLNTILRKLEALQGGDRNWMGWESKQAKLKRFPIGNQGEEKDLKLAGISIWPRPFLIDSEDGRIAVLVMETNGLHYDVFDSLEALTSIFCLSFLTSSILIYNTCEDDLSEDAFMPWIPYLRFGKKALEVVDSLDDKPFQNLSFLVLEWSKPEDFDFGETDGKKYLFEQIEQLLDTKTNKYVTKVLKEYFTSAGCFLLPPAGEGFKNAAFDGTLEMLDMQFLKKLEKYIGGLVSPTALYIKKVYKTKLTGKSFQKFLMSYTELINSYNRGSGDLTGDTLHSVSMATLANCIIDKTVSDYSALMENQKEASTYADENSLLKMHVAARKQAELFLKTTLPKLPQKETEDCRTNLTEKIGIVFDKIRNENQQHREDFINKNVNAVISKYEQRLQSKFPLNNQTTFYDESTIQAASSDSLNIRQQLYDSCLTEGDDDFKEIKQIVLEKSSQFLRTLLQKNSRNLSYAEGIIAAFNEELINGYKEEMKENTEETIDIQSLRFMHKQLKRAAIKDFKSKQSTFPGTDAFQKKFLQDLENALDEIFTTYECGEKNRIEDQQQKSGELANSLKHEYEQILKSNTSPSMTPQELSTVHSNALAEMLRKFDMNNPFPPSSTNGAVLRQSFQRDLETTNQMYISTTLEQQKSFIEVCKRARDRGLNLYIEAMEREMKSGFLQETSLEQMHKHQLKKVLEVYENDTKSVPDSSIQRAEMEERITDVFENLKIENTTAYKQANAEAEKLVAELQQKYVSRMEQGKYRSQRDVEGAHKQCLEEYYKKLDATLGEKNAELKETYFGKLKGMVQTTYQHVVGNVESNNERERLQFISLIHKVQAVYHDEMAKETTDCKLARSRDLEILHEKVSKEAISSCAKSLKIQVSPENRKRLIKALEDSFTKYQMQYTMNKSSQIQRPAIGIDLGTTYCCVAVIWKDKKMKIINNTEGDSTTASYVAFQKDGSHIVGQPAKDDAYRNPENTIFDAKRMIGRRMNDKKLEEDMKFWPFSVVEDKGVPKINIRKKPQPPEFVSAVLLSELKAQAEEQLGIKVDRAVITVPAYFDDGQRAATVDAGEMAGFEVLTILNEPTAAAIAYKVENFSDLPRKVLVYDLGGGTFDVAVLQTGPKSIEVLGVDGDTHLGGEDFDKHLMEECVKIFKKDTGIDLLLNKDSTALQERENARRILRRLQTYSEKAKKQLSTAMQAAISIDGIIGGQDLYAVITRTRFEELNQKLFNKTIEIVDKALKDAGVRKEDIDDILLVGGSTRIPKIREMLSAHFNNKKLSHSVHPDTAVANGAAVQAALLNGGNGEKLFNFESIQDVTPMSLGIEADIGQLKDRFSVIIHKNTKIPHKATDTYKTTADKQKAMKISVYQGENDIARENNLLGTFQLNGIPPASKGAETVDVTMEIDKMGILHVTAECKSTRDKKSLTVQANKGRLSPEEKKSMAVEIEKVAKKPAVGLPTETEAENDDSLYDGWNISAARDQKDVNEFEVTLEE